MVFHLLVLLGYMIAGLIVYAPSLEGEFLYDDIHEIEENEDLNWNFDLALPFFKANLLPVRPFPYFTFLLNKTIHQNEVLGYHLVNIVIHVLNAWMIYLMLKYFQESDSAKEKTTISKKLSESIVPISIASIWLVHPLGTNAVGYVYQRIELLWSCFLLLAITTLLASNQARGAWKYIWLLLSMISCYLGMISKEVMVVAPVLLLIVDYIFCREQKSWTLKSRVPIYSCYASSWVLLYLNVVSQQSVYAENTEEMPTRWNYLLTESEVVLHYMRLAIWPDPLNFSYGWKIVDEFDQVVLPFLLLTIILGIGCYYLYRMPRIGFWFAWFFLILAPTSSINPVLEPAAEYRMYLPVLAIIVGVYKGLEYLLYGKQQLFSSVLISSSIIVALLGYVTFQRNIVLASKKLLWEDTARKSPHSYTPWSNLAIIYRQQGDYTRAIESAERALGIKVEANTLSELGISLGKIGNVNAALQAFKQAINIAPEHANHYLNAGNLYKDINPQLAIQYYQQALQKESNSAETLNNLAMVLSRNPATYQQAYQFFVKSLIERPNNAEAHNNFALLLDRMNRTEEAISHLRMAVQINPGFETAQRNLQILLQGQTQPK